MSIEDESELSARGSDPATDGPGAPATDDVAQSAGDAAESAADTEAGQNAASSERSSRTGRPEAQAASRARRIGGGSRPRPGPRPSPGPRPEPRPEPALRRRDEAEATSLRLQALDRATVLRWLPVTVACVLVVGLLIADLLLFTTSRNQPSKAERREQLVASVNSAVAMVLSYDYRHVDQDASAAAANLTGTFKDDYVKSMATTVERNAPGVKAVVTGEVGSSGIASVSSDGKQAIVLVLGQQTVSNTSLKTPRLDTVSLRVTALRIHGKWLIAKLDQL